MSSSWISRTLCSVPSIVSLDTDEGECSSASSYDSESPREWNPTRERIKHSCSTLGHDCAAICTPLEVELGYDVGTSIEVQRVDSTIKYEKESSDFINHYPVLDEPFLSPQNKHLAFLLCNGLDMLYGNDDDSVDELHVVEEIENPKKKNRSSNPGSRRQRIQNLQRNLAPFDVDDLFLAHQSMSAKYSPIEMNKRVYSFSDVDIKSPSTSCKSNFRSISSAFDISLGDTCALTRTSDINLFDVEDSEDENDEEFCYDSDPGELLFDDNCTLRQRIPKNYVVNNKCSVTNQEFQTLWSKAPLVWHRQFEKGAFSDNPTAVCAWVENGSYTNNRLIQPKLMWQEMFGKDQKDGRTVLISRNLHSIDLLDISKVVPLKRCNRTMYPFVKKNSAFLVRYDDFELIFEAKNEEKRDNLVEALKLTISRLGSMVVTGDRSVLDEFFTPVGNAVPGEMPNIMQI